MTPSFNKSVAFRLLGWLFVFIVLPLIVMAVFSRQDTANEFQHTVLLQAQQQAESNAASITRITQTITPADFIAASQPHNGIHFLMDTNGVYLAHPDSHRIGLKIQNDYSLETITKISQSKSGAIFDLKTNQALGYAYVSQKAWIDVIVLETSATNSPVEHLQQISFIQLLLSLIFVFIASLIIISTVTRYLSIETAQISANAASYQLAENNLKTQISSLVEHLSESNNTSAVLQESEKHFHTLFDFANDAVFVYDLEVGAVLQASEKFIQLFGYLPEDLPSLNLENLSSDIPPYTYRSIMHWIRRARRFGPQALEWQVRDKFGRLFWADIGLRLVTLDGQERLLISARDINERKRAEQLQIAVYRIFQTSQSAQTTFEFFSLIHEILGYLIPVKNFLVAFYDPVADLFTYPFHSDQYEKWPSIHPADDGLITHVLRVGEPLLITPETMADFGIAPLGESDKILLDWLGVPLQTARGVLGVLVLKNYDELTRLTEQDKETFAFFSTQVGIAVERKRAEDALREAEARWRTLIENSHQLIMTINRQGKILLVNHTIPGIDGENLKGQMIFEFLPGEDTPQKQEIIQQLFSTRSPLSFEISLPQKNGDAAWFSCNLSPVVDQSRVDLAIFNAIDITELKHAESAVRRSEAIYRQAIEAAGAVPYYRDHHTSSFRFIGAGIHDIAGISHGEITTQMWEGLIQESHMLGDATGLSIDQAAALAKAGKLKIWQCDYQIHALDGKIRWVYDAAI